jgi:hypothetical protein
VLTAGRGEVPHRIVVIGFHPDQLSSQTIRERGGVVHRPAGVVGAVVPDEHWAGVGDRRVGRHRHHRTWGIRRQPARDAALQHVVKAGARRRPAHQHNCASLGGGVVERGDNEAVEHHGLDVVAWKGLDDALQHPVHAGSFPLVEAQAHLPAQHRVPEASLPRHGGLGAGVEDVDHLQWRAQRAGEPRCRLDGPPCRR